MPQGFDRVFIDSETLHINALAFPSSMLAYEPRELRRIQSTASIVFGISAPLIALPRLQNLDQAGLDLIVLNAGSRLCVSGN